VAGVVRRWDAGTGRERAELRPSSGYSFVLRPPPRPEPEPPYPSLGAALAGGESLRLQILRDGRPLREQSVRLAPGVELRLKAGRDGDRLTFQADDHPELEVQDLLPLGATRPGA